MAWGLGAVYLFYRIMLNKLDERVYSDSSKFRHIPLMSYRELTFSEVRNLNQFQLQLI